MKIWAHTIVQNEERYVWYSITSVIQYVDKILVWDTGSTDKTVPIIKEVIKRWPNKISFKEVGPVTPDKFTSIRQQMLKETKSDWFFILDGDEVWWEDEIKKVLRVINDKNNYESIVSEYVNLVGDIFHYQDKSAGKYKIKNKEGFVTIRLMNLKNIEGLKISKPHGQQGVYDSTNRLIQDRDSKKMYFLENPSYLHFTNLPRSGGRDLDLKVPKRGFKLKYELGKSFPLNFYYPEVFFSSRPEIVTSPWTTRDGKDLAKALLQTPLKKIKRKLFTSKSGY